MEPAHEVERRRRLEKIPGGSCGGMIGGDIGKKTFRQDINYLIFRGYRRRLHRQQSAAVDKTRVRKKSLAKETILLALTPALSFRHDLGSGRDSAFADLWPASYSVSNAPISCHCPRVIFNGSFSVGRIHSPTQSSLSGLRKANVRAFDFCGAEGVRR